MPVSGVSPMRLRCWPESRGGNRELLELFNLELVLVLGRRSSSSDGELREHRSAAAAVRQLATG